MEHVSENLYAVMAKDLERAQLARDVDAFMARGGAVRRATADEHEGTRPASRRVRGSASIFLGQAAMTERQKNKALHDKRVAERRTGKAEEVDDALDS